MFTNYANKLFGFKEIIEQKESHYYSERVEEIRNPSKTLNEAGYRCYHFYCKEFMKEWKEKHRLLNYNEAMTAAKLANMPRLMCILPDERQQTEAILGIIQDELNVEPVYNRDASCYQVEMSKKQEASLKARLFQNKMRVEFLLPSVRHEQDARYYASKAGFQKQFARQAKAKEEQEMQQFLAQFDNH